MLGLLSVFVVHADCCGRRVACMTSITDLELCNVVENALRSYCRGIDRLHGESIAAAFHPGALLIDYGTQSLTIEAFVGHAVTSLGRRFVATQHRISNTSIERHGATALVETYVHATHVEETADGRKLHTFVGRYIDRFEDRDGIWKIAQRTLRNDWSTVVPMAGPMSGSYVPSGRGDAPDPIWQE
jgi:SnoaL-like domain